MKKKLHIIRILTIAILIIILLISLYIPLGLHFKYVTKDMLTPYPFTYFYFRSITGLIFLGAINIVIIYFLYKAKQVLLCTILICASLFSSFLIGQQISVTYSNYQNVWFSFPIQSAHIKNNELLRIQQSEDSPYVGADSSSPILKSKERSKYPNAKRFNEEENWLFYQYGEKDSCIKIFNAYPSFLKLKKQQIR